MTTAYNLLSILQKYAPSAREQYLASKWYNELRETVIKEHEFSERQEFEIEKTLINALADGVNHGNWPWTRQS